jgi:dolichyl-phosphate-mannose-protein mannosyltransferase
VSDNPTDEQAISSANTVAPRPAGELTRREARAAREAAEAVAYDAKTAPLPPRSEDFAPTVPQPNSEDDTPRGTRLDDWWARTLATPARQKLWYWGGPLAVTAIGAGLRLWDLGQPHSLIFDETFYVKDAWSLWNNGYETTWPAETDPRFAAGETNIFTTEGSYVVHPPLGKWLIALGMAAFGAHNAFGWRVSVAVAGILMVLLIALIARRLTGSTLLAVIAGGLLAIDGHAIVLSRVSLLDNFVALFVLAGFGLMLIDREWSRRRLGEMLAARRARVASPHWGPTLWWRPWLVAAGLTFGLAISVKWSGLYFLAAFGLYVIVMDALDRRREGLPFWLSASLLKQAPAAFIALVPIAAVTYVLSWTGWILTAGGYGRHTITPTNGLAWSGPFAWVPDWAQNLWLYHQSAYAFHTGLTVAHPYQANPLTWLFMIRPTSMFYEGSVNGENGCTFDSCSAAITALANPLIWWAGTAAIGYLIYRFARWREWRVGFILMGMVAGYLPWLMYMNRTVFQFYGIIYEPYMILALTFTIGIILGNRTDATWRRLSGIRVVAIYLGFVILVSAFFFPIWSGIQVPYWFWQAHMWLPTWI